MATITMKQVKEMKAELNEIKAPSMAVSRWIKPKPSPAVTIMREVIRQNAEGVGGRKSSGD